MIYKTPRITVDEPALVKHTNNFSVNTRTLINFTPTCGTLYLNIISLLCEFRGSNFRSCVYPVICINEMTTKVRACLFFVFNIVRPKCKNNISDLLTYGGCIPINDVHCAIVKLSVLCVWLFTGIDISSWTLKSKQTDAVTFSVWDFAGQTVYYNTHQVRLTTLLTPNSYPANTRRLPDAG